MSADPSVILPASWVEMPHLAQGGLFGVPVPNQLPHVQHIKGAKNCPSCWWYAPEDCACGNGLVHFAAYDLRPTTLPGQPKGEHQFIVGAELCDACGRNYR